MKIITYTAGRQEIAVAAAIREYFDALETFGEYTDVKAVFPAQLVIVVTPDNFPREEAELLAEGLETLDQVRKVTIR